MFKSACAVSSCFGAFVWSLAATGADFASVQKHCPLQIYAVTSDQRDSFAAAQVMNMGPKVVERAQLGWVLWTREADGKPAALLVARGPMMDLSLAPLETARLGPQGAANSYLRDTAKRTINQRLGLTIGTVYLKLADGTEWKFDLESHRAFETDDDPDILRNLAPKIEEKLQEVKPKIGSDRATVPRYTNNHPSLEARNAALYNWCNR